MGPSEGALPKCERISSTFSQRSSLLGWGESKPSLLIAVYGEWPESQSNSLRKVISVNKSVQPDFGAMSFSCPHCGALAHQTWYSTYAAAIREPPRKLNIDQLAAAAQALTPPAAVPGLTDLTNKKEQTSQIADFQIAPSTRGVPTAHVSQLYISKCYSCKKLAIWLFEKLTYPATQTGEAPHPDMPSGVAKDYEEARKIVAHSARGAAALLRLCIQRLCKELALPGSNLNDDIGQLVKRGLPDDVRKALDSLRVIGNESVHPGTIDISDDQQTALRLFTLVNFIVERMISFPRQVAAIHDMIPEGAKKNIERRDS